MKCIAIRPIVALNLNLIKVIYKETGKYPGWFLIPSKNLISKIKGNFIKKRHSQTISGYVTDKYDETHWHSLL